jgi:hypothetical protein
VVASAVIANAAIAEGGVTDTNSLARRIPNK